MKNTVKNSSPESYAALLVAACSVLGFAGLPAVAQAQTAHHHGFFHRHPTATGIGAGAVAYEAAKHSGNHAAKTGHHRNFMQRHPMATGIVAGAVAHHMAKHHR